MRSSTDSLSLLLSLSAFSQEALSVKNSQEIVLSGQERGWGPQVSKTDEKFIYSIPVSSSFVIMDFNFEIQKEGVEALQKSSYRFSVLHHVLHTLIQNTFGPSVKNPKHTFGQADFDQVSDFVLHSTEAELQEFISSCEINHNISLKKYID